MYHTYVAIMKENVLPWSCDISTPGICGIRIIRIIYSIIFLLPVTCTRVQSALLTCFMNELIGSRGVCLWKIIIVVLGLGDFMMVWGRVMVWFEFSVLEDEGEGNGKWRYWVDFLKFSSICDAFSKVGIVRWSIWVWFSLKFGNWHHWISPEMLEVRG